MATSDLVPGLFDVAINGVPYRARAELHTRKFHESIKQQADTSREPSEASLNPEDLWRRGQADFRLGEGQEYLDSHDEADRIRYWTSAGLDPWDERELKLLRSVTRVDAFTGTIGKAVLCNGQVFVIRGTSLAHWDGSSWTATGALATTIRDIATDGVSVYIAARDDAKTSGGVYVINTATDAPPYTPVLLNSVIPDLVGYVLGRLMVTAGYDLYNITDTSTTTAPTAITAAAINEQWVWDAFSNGPGFILVAGHGGNVSMVYRITIREDGTALTAPVVAATLPDGEQVQTMTYYLGVLLLGTSKGLRVAPAQGGSLAFGSLVDIGPVHSLEPQERFVWCGMSDGTLTRVDLSRFIPSLDLAPAYASDLVGGTSAVVPAVLTFNDRRLFVIKDTGVFYESATAYVASGTYNSGRIGYGLIDPKQFVFLDVRANALAATESVDVALVIDDGAAVTLGSLTSADNDQTFTITDDIADPTGETAQVQLTLKGDGSSTPVVTRWVLRSEPVVRRTEEIRVVLDLHETVLAYSDQEHLIDVWAAFEALQTLARSGTIVDYQEFGRTYKASVSNVQWGPQLKVTQDRQSWEGPCLVTIKVYP